jgi:hypothetical protein
MDRLDQHDQIWQDIYLKDTFVCGYQISKLQKSLIIVPAEIIFRGKNFAYLEKKF